MFVAFVRLSYTASLSVDMESISFAYYILMLAIGLKIIHAFYSQFKKKKTSGKEQTEERYSLSLFGSADKKADGEEREKE